MPITKAPILLTSHNVKCDICFRPIPQTTCRKDYVCLQPEVYAHVDCVIEQMQVTPGQLAVVNHVYGAQQLSIEGQPSMSRLPFGTVIPILAVGSPPNSKGVFYLSHRLSSVVWYDAYYLNPCQEDLYMNKFRRRPVDKTHLRSLEKLGYDINKLGLLEFGTRSRRSQDLVDEW